MIDIFTVSKVHLGLMHKSILHTSSPLPMAAPKTKSAQFGNSVQFIRLGFSKRP